MLAILTAALALQAAPSEYAQMVQMGEAFYIYGVCHVAIPANISVPPPLRKMYVKGQTAQKTLHVTKAECTTMLNDIAQELEQARVARAVDALQDKDDN